MGIALPQNRFFKVITLKRYRNSKLKLKIFFARSKAPSGFHKRKQKVFLVIFQSKGWGVPGEEGKSGFTVFVLFFTKCMSNI